MILEVKSGFFSYNRNLVLKDVSFDLKHQEIVTILGPNGVGKTTLLKCVMDFLHWDKGMTLLGGKPVSQYSSRQLWHKISYVPQMKQSVFSYGVLDMIVMGLNSEQGFFKTPKKEDYDRAEAMLNLLGVTKLANRYCNELSGGELQMVMMARALVSRPELLILDEPESNLDMRNQIKVLNSILRAADEMKTACLINTHFPNHALNISQRTLLLGSNSEIRFGPTKDMITESSIEHFFRVRSKIVSFEAEEKEYQTIYPYRIVSR